ncbi:hypothetical protein [Corynebacterium sp. HMSC04H06]|uniref:pyroglutamyl-peptidase I family protein n=1 Tax=Corynebacterium sp. HMSC04H06 TaxID=1581050 RepID=UPI0009F6B1CA
MPSLLVTAFGPFGPSSYNPTSAALPGIESALADAADVTTAVLPVEFAAAREQLDKLIAGHSPDFVVCLGLAESRHRSAHQGGTHAGRHHGRHRRCLAGASHRRRGRGGQHPSARRSRGLGALATYKNPAQAHTALGRKSIKA